MKELFRNLFPNRIKKKRRRNGRKGAVTIFLTIVLVPTIVFAAVFTDVSRVQYSKTMAESAGDLALDSLIARYDEHLEQYYGMVASCQDIDSFYQKSMDYFAGMMRAEGIKDANVAQIVDYVNQVMKDGNISDFLRTELDSAGLNISDMDSHLDRNAALLEDQIVEFMKYRGPIEISKKLVDRLLEKGPDNVMGDLEEAAKNEPVVQEKKEYAQAESDFLEKIYYTYLAIRVYEKAYDGIPDASEEGIPSQRDYKNLEEDTKKIWDDYKELTRLLTNYYMCSGDVNSAKSIADRVPNYPLDWKYYDKEDIGTKVTVDGTDHYYLYRDTYESLYSDSNYQDDIDAVTNAAGEIYRAMEAVAKPSNESDVDEVVYLTKLKEALDGQKGNFDTIRRCGERLLILYAKIEAALDCEEDPEAEDYALPYGWDDDLSREKGRRHDCWASFLRPRSGDTQSDSNYKTWIKKYISLSDRVKDNIDNEGYRFNSVYLGENDVKPSYFLGKAGPDLKRLRDILQKRYNEIVNALGPGKVNVAGQEKEVVKIDELLTLYNKYIQEREEWGNTAKNTDTTYAGEEVVHYENVRKYGAEEGEGSETGAIFSDIENNNVMTKESIDELKNRLVAIKDDMKKAIDAIDNFKYGSTSISDISSLSGLKAAASGVIPTDSDISISVNNKAAEGYFNSLIHPGKDEIYKAPEITEKNNPDLAVSTPRLYRWLWIKFHDNEDEIDQEIADNAERQEKWKEKEKEAKEKAKEADLGDATLNGHGTSPLSAVDPYGNHWNPGEQLLGAIMSIINTFKSGGTEIRDKILVMEYVMDMFSYSSYNTEGKRRLAGDGTTYKDFDSYNNISGWDNEDLSFTENKSLTNRMINSTNNQFNLAEVEYVIFGDTDMKGCLSKSYGSIYAIRFALDLVSGFANFYNKTDLRNYTATTIDEIALAIAAASQGVIPVPITKCILITTLSAIEAAKDLEILKKGDCVALYKQKYTEWVCALNPDGDKDASFDGPDQDVARNAMGLYYHDYMYLFLMLTNYESMLYRVGDLVEADMRQTNGDFDLNKSKCFFKLTGHAKVKPLMITLPIVQSFGTGNLLGSDTWCSYDIKVIRGY